MHLRKITIALSFMAIIGMLSERADADLTNASFESVLEYGDPNAPNWFAFFGVGSTGTFSTSDMGYSGTIDPTDGMHHLSIANDGTAMGFSGVFQRVAGDAGAEYTFSFDARSNSGASFPMGAEFRLEFLDAADGLISATPNTLIGGLLTDSYQTFSLSAVAPAGTAKVVPVIAIETFSASGTPGDLFVDNASLSVVPEPASAALLAISGLCALARRRR